MYLPHSAQLPSHVINGSYLTALCETLDVEQVKSFLEDKLSSASEGRKSIVPILPANAIDLTPKPILLIQNYIENPFVFGLNYILNRDRENTTLKELSDVEKEKIAGIYKVLAYYLLPTTNLEEIRENTANAGAIAYVLAKTGYKGHFNLSERAILEIDSETNLDFFLQLLGTYGIRHEERFFSLCAKNAVILSANNFLPNAKAEQAKCERVLERLYRVEPSSPYTTLNSTAYQELIVYLLENNEKASSPYTAVVSPVEEKTILKLLTKFFERGLQLEALNEPDKSFFPNAGNNRTRFMAALGLKTESVELVKKVACHTHFDTHQTKAEISRLLWQAHQAYKSTGARFLMGLTPEEVEKYKLEFKVNTANQKSNLDHKLFKI